jgi:hypothetical protein
MLGSSPIWTIKPPAGTPLDRKDPINAGLVRSYLFNEKGGLSTRDLAIDDAITATRINADTAYGVSKIGPVFYSGADGSAVRGLSSAAGLGITSSSVTVSFYGMIGSPNGFLSTIVNLASSGALFSSRAVNGDTGFTLGVQATGPFFIADGPGLALGTTGSISLSVLTPYSIVGVYTRDTTDATYGGAWNVYVNGVKDANSNNYLLAGSFSGTFSAGRSFVGSAFSASNQTSDSIIARATVWNRALSRSEILRLYKEPFAGCYSAQSMMFGISAGGAPTQSFVPMKRMIGMVQI